MLRFLTGGESHGMALTAIVEGLPAGLGVDQEMINRDLARRQMGYGRGQRMQIESDQVQILSGVRGGKTLGSPITMQIRNRDWENWKEVMAVKAPANEARAVTRPRPGHADLAGGIKYDHKDFRNVLERASARETAVRVAVGALAKVLLQRFHVSILGHVLSIGGSRRSRVELARSEVQPAVEGSPVRCLDGEVEKDILGRIEKAQAVGETLGGVFEVCAFDVPVGLGSYVHWDKRLDADLARAVMSIPAIKGVEIGLGFEAAERPGSEAHDVINYRRDRGFFRETNRAGGIEGGVSNGETIVVRAAMKPIPTLGSPLRSIHIISKRESEAAVERSDVTAVPSACVIAEAAVAIVLAGHMIQKFGGDSIEEMQRNYQGYISQVKSL
ncbi:MAG: chorismate synthase [bacterium]|nr:MAG: chorismate synthase [bacterium]